MTTCSNFFGIRRRKKNVKKEASAKKLKCWVLQSINLCSLVFVPFFCSFTADGYKIKIIRNLLLYSPTWWFRFLSLSVNSIVAKLYILVFPSISILIYAKRTKKYTTKENLLCVYVASEKKIEGNLVDESASWNATRWKAKNLGSKMMELFNFRPFLLLLRVPQMQLLPHMNEAKLDLNIFRGLIWS